MIKKPLTRYIKSNGDDSAIKLSPYMEDAQRHGKQGSGILNRFEASWPSIYAISVESLMSAIRLAKMSASVLALSLVWGTATADEEARTETRAMRIDYDQATAIRLDQPAKTVVVGNSSIAEALLVNDRTIYVQGRIFGNTNLIALDANGTEILNTLITVGAPLSSQVTLYRGNTQSNLACSPRCERTVTMGDTDVDTHIKNSSGKMDVAKAGTDLSTKP